VLFVSRHDREAFTAPHPSPDIVALIICAEAATH
jgi:hypothetical protein